MAAALALLAAAVACLVATALLLRSVGTGYRVGRLLAVAREVPIDEARAMAGGRPAYVRVTGRISSDEEFPDENDRPLVYRRKRIEIAGPGRGGWRTVSEEREAVRFGIETRSAFIAVDEAAIDVGLVAIPRESAGLLGDLPRDLALSAAGEPGNAPDESTDEVPARLVIEQLSAVEHATVCGVPVLREGEPALSAGLGRPLIVTTLAAPEAMRLLAASHRRRVLAAALLLGTAVVLGGASLVVALTAL